MLTSKGNPDNGDHAQKPKDDMGNENPETPNNDPNQIEKGVGTTC